MIILKLGGSIITEKNSIDSAINEANLKRISGEIKKFMNNSDKQLVIVHGAGSFGHPPAKQYNIGKPFSDEEYPEKRIGFSKTQNAVKKLNMFICESFINEDIPVIAIPASAFMTSTNKRISNGNLDKFKQYLEKGYVPVIYGDVVIDEELEMAVISGDQIIQYLAINLKPEMVILGTDVDGVYNKNPKLHDDAKFIDLVSSLDDLDLFEETTTIDVTGGMVGKIKELLELANLGIDSQIINADLENNIFNALENNEVKRTVISKK